MSDLQSLTPVSKKFIKLADALEDAKPTVTITVMLQATVNGERTYPSGDIRVDTPADPASACNWAAYVQHAHKLALKDLQKRIDAAEEDAE